MGLSAGQQNSQSGKLITHLQLVLRLRISGSILPLPHVPSWHAQGQTDLQEFG
jgi:hypothetical protein